EMRSNSVLQLESASDGLRVRLNDGSVIVTAAKRQTGHLYVQTKDLTVSVVGTVFLVSAQRGGSHVAVIAGEVRVQHGTTSRNLLRRAQVTTYPTMPSLPLTDEIQ